MRSPVDLATAETMEYLQRVLPAPGARILEVGCGAGDVALGLGRAGYDVIGLDVDPDVVGVAKAKGVDATVGSFPLESGVEGPFDAVLFTRSLHHIEGLPAVYDRTRELLANDGVLVVEDWAWNRVDVRTATFASRLLQLGAELGLSDLDRWMRASDPHEAWHEEHGHHDLHFGETMWGAAGRWFDTSEIERAPYFYRYFCAGLPDDQKSLRIAARILAMERAMIREGQIIALGMRFSGRRR